MALETMIQVDVHQPSTRAGLNLRLISSIPAQRAEKPAAIHVSIPATANTVDKTTNNDVDGPNEISDGIRGEIRVRVNVSDGAHVRVAVGHDRRSGWWWFAASVVTALVVTGAAMTMTAVVMHAGPVMVLMVGKAVFTSMLAVGWTLRRFLHRRQS